MNEIQLKYGCNPNQKPSRIFMEEGELPITVLNGKPGYIYGSFLKQGTFGLTNNSGTGYSGGS